MTRNALIQRNKRRTFLSLSLSVHVILYVKRISILKLWSRESLKIWKLTVASSRNFIQVHSEESTMWDSRNSDLSSEEGKDKF